MFKFIEKIKKTRLNQAVARLSDSLLYGTDWNGPCDISINVKDHYFLMKIKAELLPLLHKREKPIKVDFNFRFILPQRKYNPVNAGKNFNNISDVFIEEFRYNSRNSQLYLLSEEQFNNVKKFCQRIVQSYFLEFQTVYSHALDALCKGKSFDYKQSLKLKVSRYSEHNREWRCFRYQRYTKLFGAKLDFRNESAFDEGYNIALMRNFKKKAV